MIQLKPGISPSQFNKGRKPRGRARSRRGTGAQRAGLHFRRVFSDAKCAPFAEVEWEQRTAEITDDSAKVIFKQENIEVPAAWSELATKIAVSKYFYGDIANGTDPE
jgi:ribonucleoside-diphosphate reductase alpha chain